MVDVDLVVAFGEGSGGVFGGIADFCTKDIKVAVDGFGPFAVAFDKDIHKSVWFMV